MIRISNISFFRFCWKNEKLDWPKCARTNEAEPELITDIRNRDEGLVLFCFCFDLFVCSFLKVKGGGIFFFGYISFVFFL